MMHLALPSVAHMSARHLRAVNRRPKVPVRTLATLLLVLAAAATSAVPAAGAQSRDVASTTIYVEADYQLMRSAVGRISKAEAVLQAVLRGVEHSCPRAAAGSPQNALSTELSDEVIGAMVLAVVNEGLSIADRFVHTTEHLRWSSRPLTRQVQDYVANVRILSTLPAPGLCPDVRAWAASGFHQLPSSTQAFDRRFMPAWVAAGELPEALSRYERGATRTLARRAVALQETFGDFEARAVETYGKIMNALELSP
jgi:hypothetical protein